MSEYEQKILALQNRSSDAGDGHSHNAAQRLFTDKIISDLYCFSEFVAVVAIGLIIIEIYIGGILEETGYIYKYILPIILMPSITILKLRHDGQYHVARLVRFWDSLGPVASALALACVAMLVLGFVTRSVEDYSRIWFFSWFGASLVTLWFLRALASRIFRNLSKSGRMDSAVAIYGYGEPLAQLIGELEISHPGMRLVGIYGTSGMQEAGPRDRQDEALGKLIAQGKAQQLDRVIVAVPLDCRQKVEGILTALSVLPSEVQLYPGVFGGRVTLRGVSTLNALQLLDVQRKPISDWSFLGKLIEDYVVAGVAAIVLAPVFALIALAIKFDSRGPVFFGQRRHGFNNRMFTVWKFRTMNVMEDGEDFVQAQRDDPRVTRVGAFLRRTSLDELPQIFNVLKGEMSIVGPRPHVPALSSRYAGVLALYENRNRVKPGITGWAQINGYRGETRHPDMMRKRVEYDLEYIDNWSLLMDFKIIAATPFVGLVHRNAF